VNQAVLKEGLYHAATGEKSVGRAARWSVRENSPNDPFRPLPEPSFPEADTLRGATL